MSSKSQKRKNKKKYFQSSKKPRGAGLEVGMKGFLITCNDEHRCVKEAYNLLNEFADEMYGPEFKQDDESNDIDISEQLAKELSDIKSKRRFQQVYTKLKGTIFINTTLPDPVPLLDKIFNTVINTGKKRTRFILKFKPVIMTCKAHESDIRKALDEILQQYSSNPQNKTLKYKVECKVRLNDTITQSHILWYVRDSVTKVAPDWSACILEPNIIISFHILRNVCCISILDKNEEYKKYNLSIAATPAGENQENAEGIKKIKSDDDDGCIKESSHEDAKENAEDIEKTVDKDEAIKESSHEDAKENAEDVEKTVDKDEAIKESSHENAEDIEKTVDKDEALKETSLKIAKETANNSGVSSE